MVLEQARDAAGGGQTEKKRPEKRARDGARVERQVILSFKHPRNTTRHKHQRKHTTARENELSGPVRAALS